MQEITDLSINLFLGKLKIFIKQTCAWFLEMAFIRCVRVCVSHPEGINNNSCKMHQ